MLELQRMDAVLKKHRWKYLGRDGSETGYDAPVSDQFVCSISKEGWRIEFQWSGSPPDICSQGKTPKELDDELTRLDGIKHW